MSFIDCIRKKLDDGLLTDSQYEKVKSRFESTYEKYRQTMGNDDAAAAAAAKVTASFESEIIKTNVNKIKAAKKQIEVTQLLESRFQKAKTYYNGLNKFSQSVHSIFNETGSYGVQVRDLLETSYTRASSIRRMMATEIYDLIEKNRAKYAGLTQDTSIMPDIVKAMIDGTSNNAEANAMAAGLKRVFKSLRDMHTSAGGYMGNIENYFPSRHISELVKKVSFEEWKDFILPLLNRDKMIDLETGLPFTDEKLLAEMLDDYQTITSRGLNKIQERADAGMKTFGKGGEISKRRDNTRFYIFKNADSYLKYNNEFGVRNEGLFDAVLHYIDGMSRDIGLLQTLGPSPKSLMRHLDLQMMAHETSRASQQWTNGMFDIVTGANNSDGLDPIWYRTLEGLKDVMRSAYLGSAPLSALSDQFFVGFTAKQNGLDVGKVMKRYYSLLNPADATDRGIAARNGYIIDSVNGQSFSAARYADELSGNKTTRWMANFTQKASGLQTMTNAGRDAIALEAQGMFADLKISKTKWSDLDATLKESLQSFGITEKDYDLIMKAEIFNPPETQNINFLRSDEIAKLNLDTALKVEDWIQFLRSKALNEPGLRTRAITTGAAFGAGKSGTIGRAFFSSLFMFKTFPITLMINHIGPAMAKASVGKVGDLSSILIATTLLGAAATQSSNIVKGNNPQPMDDPKFWRQAMMRGGGLGLFGDFIFSDKSRYGRSATEELLGPVYGFGRDVTQVFLGNLDKSITGEKSNFATDLFRLASRNIPAGNIWYSRLVLQRMVLDQMERLIDPRFDHKVKLMEDRMLEEKGMTSWWGKGDFLPE